jgi:FkbM family methyltransferase
MATEHAATLPEHFQDRLVIFGAGGLGRRIARGLLATGIRPLAFCDNNRALWGNAVEGVQAMSPKAAAEQFPEAVFLIAIWHPSQTEGLLSRTAELRRLGCRHVTTFIPLLWRFPEILLPNLFWELPEYFASQRPAIDAAREQLDEEGKREFDRQLAFRLTGDPSALAPATPGLQYFPADLVSLCDDETFIDCGAYNGDTIRDFLTVSRGRFRSIIALEPDLQNVDELMRSVNDGRIRTYPYAVGAEREVLRISCAGAASAICEEGGTEVECVALDELLAGETPTFIKMDIEGSEIDALQGAAATIRRCLPKLAVCVYHRPDDLWRVPLLLRELVPDCTLTVRSHMLDGFDTVCYCLPRR